MNSPAAKALLVALNKAISVFGEQRTALAVTTPWKYLNK